MLILKQKSGISLIILVITIVVIIIISASVILSLNNNNLLINAGKARYEQDRDSMQNLLDMTVQKVAIRYQASIDIKDGSITQGKTKREKNYWKYRMDK